MSAGQVRGRYGKDVLTRIGLRFRRLCRLENVVEKIEVSVQKEL